MLASRRDPAAKLPTWSASDNFVRMRLLPGAVEDIMDRRQFGKLALSAGAATTAAGEAGLALAQTSSVSPSDALKLPAELRPVFEQDYPRFSDA